MSKESGNISIQTENIFPIIKKWLYSEKDIFVREIVSNSNDAITKLKKLALMGEAQLNEEEKLFIKVIISKDDKTLRVIDNGIGMTNEEVKKYINQIAFSGAVDFLEKYKDKADESSQIIGHFGLGFYSVFMVSEKVVIDTLSWQPGAKAVRWTSSGGTEYTMEDSDMSERGTSVTLHLSDEALEYLDYYKMLEILEKYCSFMPYEIFLEDVSKKAQEEKKEKKLKKEAEKKEAEKKAASEKSEKKADSKAEKKVTGKTDKKADIEADRGEKRETTDASSSEKGADDITDDAEDIDTTPDIGMDEDDIEKPINDTHPLWLKAPKDCTDDEYKAFYRKVFRDFNDPLFWIHLNMDYPFNLKGILYFPKLKHEFETIEGQIKLYYNQVFVADNIKEVIPEFLMLLKGVIDCPDLPLNVSRSFLQNDGYVGRISTHITKKVADKLTSLYENERDSYNKYWDDINPFVKYGCIREEKFYDRVKDIIIFKTTDGDYLTLKEYLDKNSEENKDKVFYVNDERQQAQYIRMFREHKMEAVILNTMIDNHFIQFLEMKEGKIKFLRVDADLSENLKEAEEGEKDDLPMQELEAFFKEASGNDKLKIQFEPLKAGAAPAIILLSEYSRRMQDMSKMYGMAGMDMGQMFPEEQTLVLNKNNPLIRTIARIAGDVEKKDDVALISQHVYDLAMMSHKQLEPENMAKFIERSGILLGRLADTV